LEVLDTTHGIPVYKRYGLPSSEQSGNYYKKAYRWMVIEEQEQIYSHRAHLQTHTEKGPEPSAGTHSARKQAIR
jgi:hypothetical protein